MIYCKLFFTTKPSIFILEASRANICFKNIKFPRDNYKRIAPPQKHYCLTSPLSLDSVLLFWYNSKVALLSLR